MILSTIGLGPGGEAPPQAGGRAGVDGRYDAQPPRGAFFGNPSSRAARGVFRSLSITSSPSNIITHSSSRKDTDLSALCAEATRRASTVRSTPRTTDNGGSGDEFGQQQQQQLSSSRRRVHARLLVLRELDTDIQQALLPEGILSQTRRDCGDTARACERGSDSALDPEALSAGIQFRFMGTRTAFLVEVESCSSHWFPFRLEIRDHESWCVRTGTVGLCPRSDARRLTHASNCATDDEY